MRRLFAPLSRWLDRRIDARIVAANAQRNDLDRPADKVANDSHSASAWVKAAAVEAERPRRGGSWMGA